MGMIVEVGTIIIFAYFTVSRNATDRNMLQMRKRIQAHHGGQWAWPIRRA